jgi:polar amino acid transport system substrate-binding protein
MFSKSGLFALVMVLAVAASCVPAGSQTKKVVHYDPTKTKMGEIQARGHIVVGIPSDYPPFGSLSSSGQPQGFTAGLGRLVADALGVKVQYVGRPSDQLLGIVDSDAADLVFPMVPITQDAAASHPFSDPYLLVHQRLLVPRGSGIRGLTDLGGTAVCSAIDPKTEVPLTRLDPSISLRTKRSVAGCAAPLENGRVAAVTGPDVALLGLRSQIPGSELVGGRLTTEGYGAAVSPCAPGLAEFVTRVLAGAKKDGTWTELYKRWVVPASGSSYVPTPPTLSVIDAWDLFPPTPGAPTPAPIACPTP